MEITSLSYERLVENALRGVLHQALKITEAQGLPGAHHFYITFDTTHPDVQMADSLKALHPNEMTIVVQHQYWDLVVDEEHFEIALSFSGVNQHLSIPFEAVTAFADPHAKFGLQFHVEFEEIEDEDFEDDAADPSLDSPVHVDSAKVSQHFKSSRRTVTSTSRGEAPKAENADDDHDDADNVVTLDAFRKK
jgi:uncharacterized protein